MEAEPVAVVTRVTKALDSIGVPYVIGGSFASSIHGFPRTTNDVDLVADMQPEHIQPLVDALGDEFYIEPAALAEALRLGSSFNLIHYAAAFKVDVFIRGGDDFRGAQIARGAPEHDSGHRLQVVSPEDIILAKLQWYREGGEVSERQWRDVLEVIAVQGERLDMAYLRETAEGLGLAELVRRAFSEGSKAGNG